MPKNLCSNHDCEAILITMFLYNQIWKSKYMVNFVYTTRLVTSYLMHKLFYLIYEVTSWGWTFKLYQENAV